MNLSSSGLNLIKSFEGFRSQSYQDIAGVWTIGYGHTGSDVDPNEVIDEVTALELLNKDTQTAVKGVSHALQVDVNQNQFDALVSLAYNIGVGNFEQSTLLKKLNNSDYKAAANEFIKWNKITDPKSGELIASEGLTNRRQKEAALFYSNIDQNDLILVKPASDWKSAQKITRAQWNEQISLAKEKGWKYTVAANKLYIKNDVGDVSKPAVVATQKQLKGYDFHAVADLSNRKLKLFTASGKAVITWPVRGEGAYGDFAWTGHPNTKPTGGDTPEGEWEYGAVEIYSGHKQEDIAYGVAYCYLIPLSGECATTNRSGIGHHGGGSGSPSPFADFQGWYPTMGCLRMQNKHLLEFIELAGLRKGKRVKLTTNWS